MLPKKHHFKDIIEFIDSFTKINSEYRLLFLLFKEYFIENNDISKNIIEKIVELLLNLIEIDNNEKKGEELKIELYDEDELFKDFYDNFVQDEEYSTMQTILAYYYCQICDDFQSYLESYILIKCQKNEILISLIPSNIPNITGNSTLFFQLFNEFEDNLLVDKNTGAYKIIIEKNLEKLLLKKSNLENDVFEEYINNDIDDKPKKIFKKNSQNYLGLKIK